MVWIVVFLAILFLISEAALAYVVGAAAVLSFIASDNARYLAVLPQRIFSQLDVFALMAMVFVMMTGVCTNYWSECRSVKAADLKWESYFVIMPELKRGG